MEFDFVFFVRWLHIIGACVLLGTGAGIAFFMVMAQRAGNALVIAHTASIVVLADLLFTAAAVVVQPITGTLLAHEIGWNLWEGWVLWSLVLYVFTGAFWLPVVWIQVQLKKLAWEAATRNEPLPARYHRLYRIWFACGFPAFLAVLAIIWLMISKPSF
ncbi:DUF2269 domain-containing protein [Rhizobium sp. MHM7A]|uniref:DUF2269 family protein n=1 Tax=Rhizobium sp. MHM7A TaxID=2583233 RepID=UPI001105F769|nr:DUF2269 domain-containing protein [Rhizobium sp. MHM7A]TLX16221.1 DUF2269 domain-containing protein [Rhizobium sp. MHM7A]